MQRILLSEIAAHLGGTLFNGNGDTDVVMSVAASSAKVLPKGVFVAIRGHAADGHSYLNDAFTRGAGVAVVEDALYLEGRVGIVVPDSRLALSRLAALFHGEPSAQLQVIGVTGTNGKTTTNWIIYHVLNQIGGGALRIGTLGSECMGQGSEEGSLTSPDPISLHNVMQRAVDMGARGCVMETSSHALHQARVEDVQFDVGVFTNLTRDHLDYHKTFEHYFNAKGHLYTLLAKGIKGTKGAVINLDGPYGVELWERVPALGLRDLSFGRDPRACFCIVDVKETPQMMEVGVRVRGAANELVLAVPFIGPHNAENVVAAFAAVSALGYAPHDIVNALRDTPQVPGRLERVGQGGGLRVFVDYAHTPDALLRVLQAVRVSTAGRLWCVFGCGGDRDKGKRPEMAMIAEAEADHVVVTSDNPRTEDPQSIINDILASGISATHVDLDRERAIVHAITAAAPNDTVVVAGKGHENYQIIGTTKVHFSDQEVSLKALAARVA